MTCGPPRTLVPISGKTVWTQPNFNMFNDDRIRLIHKRDAAREAVSFTPSRTRKELDTDRQLALSLVKDIEIVGEAAVQVTETARTQTPEIPWQEIIAMSNRLVHAYFDINHDIVWKTVQEDPPMLMSRLERVLGPRFRRS